MWIVPVVLILLVSLSRITSASTFRQDVLGGWIIGLVNFAAVPVGGGRSCVE